jgi:riboflavin kinase/FMN adenylyltransferase
VIPITFDLDLSDMSPKKFVARLQKHLNMRELVVGPDFAMGHNRVGDVISLTTLGTEMEFSVHVVPLFLEEGEAIRSTSVRKAISSGDVNQTANLLDRNFVLTGVVVRGAGRGRTLGFPTANLKTPQGMMVPGAGIYATWVHLDEKQYMAATSIGTRPTFGEGQRTIESFILDFKGDLYNQRIRLEFVERMRDEIKYESVEDLKNQVNRDVTQTKTILNARHPNSP